MNSVLIMDAAIACVGIYLVIVAFYMKKTGKISPLVVPEQEIGKCRKPAAYIGDVLAPMTVFGILAFAVGVFGVLCDMGVVTVGRIAGLMELLGFLLAFAGFSHQMKLAKSKYFP